ncbi:MAG TPA: hypothetical protein VK253_08305 [Candidatus Binatia bacterium]|nr:hypothetical protein [Candidatus Binatia bacterium]
MRVVVTWAGGKESCLAYQKAIAQGHKVAYLLSFIYKKPYIYHDFKVMEAQAKTMGVPQLKVKIKNDKDVLNALTRIKKEKAIEGIVSGDIADAGCVQIHRAYYEEMCQRVGLSLIMPIENPTKNTYDVLKEEVDLGIKPVLTCINLDLMGEEWSNRVLDGDSIKDLKTLANKHGVDVAGEDGKSYHTMVTDASFFKNMIEITKSKKKVMKEVSMAGKATWFLVDIKKVALRPK